MEIKKISPPEKKRDGKYKCFSFNYKNGVFTFWSNKVPKNETAITYTWEELQQANNKIQMGFNIADRFEKKYRANIKAVAYPKH